MSFLYPDFLWALFAVAIPIIIHLFNFRTHKTVYFSNVKFLNNIEQETKSRNKLKDFLILLMRILTIVCLVLAFSQPFFNKNKNSKITECENIYGIYLDNSFSLSALNSEGKSLDIAKTKASDIVSALKENSKIIYLTNEFTSEQHHPYIKDITQSKISSTIINANVRKTSFILGKFTNLFNEISDNCNKNVIIISDFQKNIFDYTNFIFDSTINVTLIPIFPSEINNLFIDSVWFDSPFHLYNTYDSLNVKIVNNSTNTYSNKALQLFINDTLKTISNFNITPNTQLDIKIKYQNTSKGFITARVELEDYPIDYDNKIYFNYYIAPIVKVLFIADKQHTFIEKFYTDNKYFELTKTSPDKITIPELSKYQAIILHSQNTFSTGFLEEFYNYIKNGGIFLYIPIQKNDFVMINTFLSHFGMPQITSIDTSKTNINKINLNDKIYKGTFEKISSNSEMPYFKNNFKLNKNQQVGITDLLTTERDDNILIYKEIENGIFYFLAIELTEKNTNFMTNPISIPTFYNIPIFSKNLNEIYNIIGYKNYITLKISQTFESIKLKNIQTNLEFVPSYSAINQHNIKFDFTNNVIDAGNYNIISNNQIFEQISFNYNRDESNLDYYTIEDLTQIIKKYNLKNWRIIDKSGVFLQNEIISNVKDKNIWKIFIIFALIFIFGEIIIIRLLK